MWKSKFTDFNTSRLKIIREVLKYAVYGLREIIVHLHTFKPNSCANIVSALKKRRFMSNYLTHLLRSRLVSGYYVENLQNAETLLNFRHSLPSSIRSVGQSQASWCHALSPSAGYVNYPV